MADLLFGLPLRQRRARIYRYKDSILICSNQKLRTCYRFGRASIEYIDELTEGNELLLHSEANRPSPDSTTILCEWWLTASSLSCPRYNWRRQVDRFRLAVHNTDAMLETITVLIQGKLHYGIPIVE